MCGFIFNKYYLNERVKDALLEAVDTNQSALVKTSPIYDDHENFRLFIPNFNYTAQQADIHLLQFRINQSQDSYNILIDVAAQDQANEKLISWLNSIGASKVDEIFITHPHRDHYGGVWTLLNSNIQIKKIWMNMPDKKLCDKELPWGCNYKELTELSSAIRSKGIQLSPLLLNSPSQGRTLYKDSYNSLELMYASTPINPLLGPMDINDLSMIMKLNTNGISYLFTGDLNIPLSNYLKDNVANLKVDILKVPHHGTESVASNEFLDRVAPSIAIVPSPQELWCSNSSKRYREYFQDKAIQAYVSGIHGDVLIRHFENAPILLEAQYPNAKACN